MSGEQLPYPEREHYTFPRNHIEQAQEELRTYAEPDEFRKHLVSVKRQYYGTPFVQTIERYSRYAAVLHTDQPELDTSRALNSDFFSGAVMAVHIHTAPAPTNTLRFILGNRFLSSFDSDANNAVFEADVREWMLFWANDETDNWATFLEQQDPRFQSIAMELAEMTFRGRPNHLERELDYLIGFTFASNIIWQLNASPYNLKPRV